MIKFFRENPFIAMILALVFFAGVEETVQDVWNQHERTVQMNNCAQHNMSCNFK